MVAAAVVAALASLPYVIVAASTPDSLQFGGLLINPIDGQSYLAKMRQGFDGFWQFRLPYTATDEPDAFVYTYHLALGHLSRVSGLSLTAVFHVARLAGGWALLLTVYALIARAFESVRERRRVWLFVALTAGLGWLGIEASDLTIPESNTFFSVLTNAHFPLAQTLLVMALIRLLDARGRKWLWAIPAVLVLAVLQPFAPVSVFAALGGFLFLRWRRDRQLPRQKVVWAVVSGLCVAPLMLYLYFAIQADPILRMWMAQNMTPSPPLIGYALGYGLMWPLAIFGARAAWRRGRDVDLLLIGWAVTSALLLYAPLPLQRRFALGLHIPLVLLAMLGLIHEVLPRLQGRLRIWMPRIVFALSLPTTLLLLLASSSAALRPPDPRLFFTRDEAVTFEWLRDHASHDAIVMAAPETGLFLPAWADVRVLYGHPFETVDAERMRTLVEQFFAGALDRVEALRTNHADYIFYGPHERELGPNNFDVIPIFTSGDVLLYQVP
jgi:hypothetical protein